MAEMGRLLKVMHIVDSIGETNSTYNEHCLPLATSRDLAISTFFKSNIHPPPTISVFEGDGSLRGFFRALKRAMDAEEYDIIHAHSLHVALLFLAFHFVVFKHAPSSSVITIHDSYPNYRLKYRLMLVPVFVFFRKIVCCSQASLASFPSMYRWLAGNRICAVPNGVDLARIDRATASGPRRTSASDAFTVIAISRLVYVGDGILRRSIEAEIKQAGLEEQITLTGLIPREKVFEHLACADLFISASRGEGLPVSVLEAMACGCPVVLSDIPPHREIAEGVDFIPLLQPDDVAGFAREIRRFTDMPTTERALVGQRCRKHVEEHFSLAAMHAGYERVYAQVMGATDSLQIDTAL